MALSESSRIQCQLLEAGENKDFTLHNTSPRRRAGTAGMAVVVSSHHHYNNRRHCNDEAKITIKSHLILHMIKARDAVQSLDGWYVRRCIATSSL